MHAGHFLLPCLAVLAGCAAATQGPTNQVHLTSEPSGAVARTSIGHQCTTPCAVMADRRTGFFVTFTLEGYREVAVPVRTRIAVAGATGAVGNVLFGGIVGFSVDTSSGAGLEHAPNPVHAALQRAGGRAGTAPLHQASGARSQKERISR